MSKMRRNHQAEETPTLGNDGNILFIEDNGRSQTGYTQETERDITNNILYNPTKENNSNWRCFGGCVKCFVNSVKWM